MPNPWRHFLYEAHATDGSASATAPGQLLGELQDPTARSISLGIRKARQAAVAVSRDDLLAPHLKRGRRVLLVVRDGRPDADPNAEPEFVGPIQTAQIAGDQIAVTAIDGWTRILKRLLAVRAADFGYSVGDGPKFTGVNQSVFMYKDRQIRRLMQVANQAYGYYIGGALPPTGSVFGVPFGSFTGVAPPAELASHVGIGSQRLESDATVFASDIIQQVSGNLDAPEWVIDPVLPRLWDPAAADKEDLALLPGGAGPYLAAPQTSLLIGRMRLGFPIGGTLRPGARFESGYGADNVPDYNHLIDDQASVNYVLSTPPDPAGFDVVATDMTWDPQADTLFGSGPGSVYEPYEVLLQDVIREQLNVTAMRQELANEHLEIRRRPRELITVSPGTDMSGAPVFGRDYFLGDLAPFHAVRRGRTEIDATVRVYGVNRALSDDGQLTDSPVLVPE